MGKTGIFNRLEERGLTRTQFYVALALSLFSLASIFYVVENGGELFSIFYCLATVPFVCLPMLLCLVFRWRLNLAFYLVFCFYALGPLLGAVYNLYYVTTWWDDLLHLLAGTMFAVCGAYLARALNKGQQPSVLLSALFGLCFSMAIAVLWEIFEHSCDVFLGSDMQSDAIVHNVVTKMGRTDGSTLAFTDIRQVQVNGVAMGFDGYLDIGLIDTMTDMIVETVGAAVYVVYALVDRERHPLIRPLKKHK